MKINELIKEIHTNAVAHGWWEEDRPLGEVLALIHSEWSEALEEYRADRGLFWRGEDGKPEGIAVELIDGVIRIFDYMGRQRLYGDDECTVDDVVGWLSDDDKKIIIGETLPEFINDLHVATSIYCDGTRWYGLGLLTVAARALYRVKLMGIDPIELIKVKHEYNKTRPWKHGKRC